MTLEEGSVEITFDAQRSHDGACGRENLEFEWEKISGPEGTAFAGPVNLSVLSVVFTQPGEYLYRLTVSTTDLPESARSRDFSITVTDGAGPDTTPFLLCDSNANGENSLADAVFTLRHLFGGESETRCEAAMDCDSDGEISLSDSTTSSLAAGCLPLPSRPAPRVRRRIARSPTARIKARAASRKTRFRRR